jgi:hypothetical protein
LSYNFPLFNTNTTPSLNNFVKFANDGFSGPTPDYFFDRSSTTASSYGTKLINVPCPNGSLSNIYTDDSATLIKVNLGSDAFTTLDCTFSATTSDL